MATKRLPSLCGTVDNKGKGTGFGVQRTGFLTLTSYVTLRHCLGSEVQIPCVKAGGW